MAKTLEEQLSELQGELKTHFAKAAEEQKLNGTMREDTKNSIQALQKQVDAMDVKLAEKLAAEERKETPGTEAVLKENEGVQRLLKDRSGRAVVNFSGKQAQNLFARKTTITSSSIGAATTGVLQIDRIPGITEEARQQLRVRDLLTARPTTMQVIDFVKVTTPMTIASPVAEASSKPENQLVFQSVSERVKTIATWIPATKQIMDDLTELAGFIDTSMPYYVNKAEEVQLLSGDGTGENLHGLIPQATAFLASLLGATAGWTMLDVVARAVQQINSSNEVDPTFIVLNPNDWWSIRLTKDGFGRYILGDPQAVTRPRIWDLDVVPTTSITQGTFLVGSGNAVASEIRDRMDVQVEISTEHADFFTKNLVAIRGEKRLALVVKRPGSYVSGAFSTSPA